MVVVAALACAAVLVPPERSDLTVATAAVNYLGGFLIAGGFLRQLRLDLTYAAPGLLMLAYLFIVFMLAQSAGEHRTSLTYLLLVAATVGAVVLVIVGALVLALLVRLGGWLGAVVMSLVAKVWRRVRDRLPEAAVAVLDAPADPDPVLPPPADAAISRRTLYLGVGFLTYGLLLTLRAQYLPF